MSKRNSIVAFILLSSAAVAHAGTTKPETKPQKPRVQQPAVHAQTDHEGYPVVGNIVRGKGSPQIEEPVTLAALDPRYIARIFSR